MAISTLCILCYFNPLNHCMFRISFASLAFWTPQTTIAFGSSNSHAIRATGRVRYCNKQQNGSNHKLYVSDDGITHITYILCQGLIELILSIYRVHSRIRFAIIVCFPSFIDAIKTNRVYFANSYLITSFKRYLYKSSAPSGLHVEQAVFHYYFLGFQDKITYFFFHSKEKTWIGCTKTLFRFEKAKKKQIGLISIEGSNPLCRSMRLWCNSHVFFDGLMKYYKSCQ